MARLVAAGIMAAVCGEAAATVGECLVARQNDGREALAVVVTDGPVALTELWVRGPAGEPRFAGSLPGRTDGLAWGADGRIRVRLKPLSLSTLGLSVVPSRSWDTAESGVWAVDPDGGGARLAETQDVPGALDDVNRSDRAPDRPGADRDADLRAIGKALNIASSAYSALHAWNFKAATSRYKEAARSFWDLRKAPTGSHFVEEPLAAYREASRRDARIADTEGPRWICREHLVAIGDLLEAYADAREGMRPTSLDTLCTWLEGQAVTADDLKLMGRLFRPTNDWEPGRTLAYYYRPEAGEGEAVLTSFFHKRHLVELIASGTGYRMVDRRIGRAEIDSLMEVGRVHYETASDSAQAISVFEMVTGIAPDYAMGHCQLANAHMKVGNLRRAMRAFRRAVNCDDQLPEAYLGLGLLFRKWPKGDYDAVRNFQKALQYRRDYVEARFNIAEIRYRHCELDAKGDIEKVLAADPKYAPAYKLMGMFYEDLRKEYDAAALYYAQYLSLRPGDKEARVRLGRAYLRASNYDRILDLLEAHVRSSPGEYELLPILAQACTKLEACERAEAYYHQYLKQVSAKERFHYEDITLLAKPEELREYLEVIGTAREPEFLGRFWASRDPNLTTAENERRLEHYRRVWYARQNFGVHEEPWDRRGEVYVRFGEPQHRSCSNDLNFDQSLEVQRVKERLTQELYGNNLSLERALGTGSGMDGGGTGLFVQGSSMSSNFAGPVFPVRSMGADATHAFSGAAVPPPDEAGEIDPMFETTLGSTRSLSGLVYGSGTAASGVPWESWVYTDIAGGIEIVFTDESGHGMYDYAPLPVGARIPPRKLMVLIRHSPRNVVSNAVSGSPDRYRTPENKNPLGFYYDVASFRSGDQDKTRVEIYLGIPYNMGRYDTDGRETRLDVTRTVALLNEATGAVYRRQGETRFRSKGDLTSRTAGFVPDVIRMEVPPGSYRMEIHATESRFKRQSRYRQEVVVPAYPTDGLKVSELELAWQVAEQGDVPEAFMKGDLSVVPMPTRTYGTGQPVYVYYEIYNLVRDGFGRTNYRVSYNVTPRESSESPGLIRGLMRIGRGKQETVGVTSDRQGTSAFEREYVALDMKAMRAGGLTLTVRVEDLNVGTPAEQHATFSLSD